PLQPMYIGPMVEERRGGWRSLARGARSTHNACFAVAVLALGACKEPRQTPATRPRGAPSASAVAASASASAAAPTVPRDAQAAELEAAFAAWNSATNAADPAKLEQLYAANLSLYSRIVSRAEAVQRKLKYVASHPGFE